MNKQRQKKKKLIAFLLSMLMLISLFQNISYTPIAESGEPETTVETEAEETVEGLPEASETDAASAQVQALSEATQVVNDGESKDLLTDAGVKLVGLELTGKYKDSNGVDQLLKFDKNDEISIPGDAGIYMDLKFSLPDGNHVTEDTDYVYKLPDTVRVDVDEIHELVDETGQSIGKVHIRKDGTLTFNFYETKVKGNSNISFYVKFEGKFSSDLAEGNKKGQLVFPTGDGNYTFNVKVEEPTNSEPDKTHQDYKLSKYGTVTTKEINGEQKKVIRWSLDLWPDGRKNFSGTIEDPLPEGLKYAGNIQVSGATNENAGTVTDISSDGTVRFKIEDYNVYNSLKIEFDTILDETYSGTITNSTQITKDNTASFNPDDTKDKPATSGKASVTVKPDVLKKTGVNNAGTITWTVEINADQFDLKDTIYTDTIGDGQSLVGDIRIEPSDTGATITNQSATGFSVDFGSSVNKHKYTITYTTQQTNWAKDKLVNNGTMTGGSFNYSVSASVPGANIIRKTNMRYDSILHTITWKIVVNQDKLNLGDTTVTDVIPKYKHWNGNQYDALELVSVTLDDGTELDITDSNIKTADGFQYKFPALDINGKTRTLTVVTKLTDEIIDEFDNQGITISNTAQLTTNTIQTPAESTASQYTNIKKTDLISKKGTIRSDGMIQWDIYVNASTLKKEAIEITDIIGDNQSYVEGSAQIAKDNWMFGDSYAIEQGNVYACTPDVNGKTLTFRFDATHAFPVDNFNQVGFYIRYYTKANLDNIQQTEESVEYNNKATAKIDFEGNISLTDTKNASVTGKVGGVVDKQAQYVKGQRTVEWSVYINKPGYDLSEAVNPRIEDVLSSYYDYRYGKLYLVGADGAESEVDASDYIVTCVNHVLTVQLPKNAENKYLGSNTYVFRFQTEFNCFPEQLSKNGISNSVSFIGLSETYTKTSETIKDIEFSSSSAGASTRHAIKLRKVDSDTKAPLQNAVFDMYVGEVKVASAQTDKDGYALFEDLVISEGAEIDIKEITAPDGYKLPTDEADRVTKVAMSQFNNIVTDNYGVRTLEIEIENQAENSQTNTGKIELTKVDAADSNVKLSGAEFTLYDALPITATSTGLMRITDSSGKVEFGSLAVGTDTSSKEYYVVETKSPDGYLFDAANRMAVKASIDASGATTYEQGTIDARGTFVANSSSDTTSLIKNTKTTATLQITKVEANTDPANGLEGAKFGLYKDAQCTDLVETATTGTNGKVEFTDLELGKTYYYREEEAPTGYVMDSSIKDVTIGAGTETAVVTKEVTVENEKENGSLRVKKVDDSVPANPIAGIQFMLKYSTGMPVQKDNSDYIVKTDENGEATFENLPYGKYTLEEITSSVPAKYKAATSIPEITIDSNAATDVTVVNQINKFKLRVVKVDANSSVALSGAKFTLYSTNGVKLDEKVTGSDGTIEFDNLEYDGYYITEMEAPEGYNKVSGRITFNAADFETTPNPSGTGWNAAWNSATNTFTITVQDTKQNGKIVLTKNDKGGNSLEGAEFTLYKDGLEVATSTSNASGKVEFTGLAYGTYTVQETKAPSVTGKTYIMDPTVYTIEVVSDTQNKVISPASASNNGQSVSSLVSLVTVINDEQVTTPPNISFKLLKQGKDGVTSAVNALGGATFGFYEIKTDGTEKLLATATSDSNGMVYFKQVNIEQAADDAKYVVRELQAPVGYKQSDQVYVLGNTKADLNAYADVPSAGGTGKADADILWMITQTKAQDAPADATVINEQVLGSVYVKKVSSYDQTALAGAEFTLYGEDGTTEVTGITNPRTTDATGGVTFKNLPLGKYVVKETKAPKGYVVSTDTQTITISDETLQNLTFKDDRIDLSISKLAVGGSTELQGAKLRITKTDGTEVIPEWTSSTTPKKISYSALETGVDYVLKETSAPAGYAYSKDITFRINADGTISTIRGANASVSGQTLVMRDAPIAISVEKVDASSTSNAPLSNAILAVIDAASGKELERFTTNETAHALDMSKITVPADNTKKDYILREISAPTGYEIAEDIIFAVDKSGVVYTKDASGYTPVSTSGSGLAGTTATLTMTDKKKPEGTIYIRKLTPAGEALSGATLAIYKETDDITTATPVVSFTSGTTPKAIRVDDDGITAETLKAGERYKLVETSAPNGYLVAKAITFTVTKNTSTNPAQYRITTISDANSLNGDKVTIMMKDQPLSLRIKKETGSGDLLAGATLKLYEVNGTSTKLVEEITTNRTNMHTVEFTKLKANKEYLLVETAAPNGFLLSGNIKFKIEADGTIAKQYLEQKDGTWKESRVAGNTVIMTDDEQAVTIRKINAGTNQGLAGAKLKLESVVYGSYGVLGYDQNFAAQTFTTTSDVISLDAKLFHTGCVYQLSEITAPTGYGYAKDVVFLYTDDHRVQYLTSSNTGADRTVYMFDQPVDLTIHKKNSVTDSYVTGAKLQIVDEAGTVVTSWTTGNDAKAVGAKLTAPAAGRKRYTLQEIEAPKGYTKATDISFEVASDGAIYIADANGDYTQAVAEITMHDEPQLQIIKQNPDGEAVAGATLTITKKDDAAFTPITWVSTDEPKVFDNSQFDPDETYILTETKAPDGYGYAKSVEFVIAADGTVKADGKTVSNHTIAMTDTPIEVVFDKQDADSRRTIAGAQIAIQNAAGDVVYTFTTTEGAVTIPKEVLQAPAEEGVLANYTFVELLAPFGYEKAEPVAFAIDSDGNVYAKNPENADMVLLSSLGMEALVMYDAPDYLHISKVDATNSEEIDGAKLAIRDADGNEIISWESSKKDGAKKLGIGEYFEADKEYTLSEVEAPKGYELAQPIVFKIDTDNVIYVKDASGAFTAVTDRTIVMKDLPSTSVVTTETTTTTSSNTSKKTGDAAPIAPITAVMFAAAVGIGVLGAGRKKKNKK